MAAKSGDTCERCKAARLNVASSQARGEYQTRYLRCPRCGHTDKHVVHSEHVRRRAFTS
jgi:DNA-directed RNA polymerase subunit M/transcription elongation factor TFIIS